MSSKNADGLPSYNQVFKMDNIATAPVLEEELSEIGTATTYNQVLKMEEIATAPLLEKRFSENIFGTATTLKFEWDSNLGPVDYTFLIRDLAGCLHAQGKVVNHNVTLTNINGRKMLTIFKDNLAAPDRINSDGTIVHTYEVHHNNARIGSVKFVEKKPAATCLTISHENSNPQIVVRSLKLGDFAIFRDQLSSTPLCNIQMSDATVYAAKEFNGTIVFQPETEITAYEQLLCTAAAIVFKVSMKKITTAQQVVATANDDRDGAWGTCLGILVFVVIIGLIIIVIVGAQKYGCESKKSRGYAGYQNVQC